MIKFEDKRGLYEDLDWYFTCKNYALKSALKYRSPLNKDAMIEMRFYYSQYFTNLLSAIDLMRSTPKAEEFCVSLNMSLDLNGADGKLNLLYLRELRNSLIHRGEDIASSAFFYEDLPVIIAPNVRDKAGKGRLIRPYRKYILQLIMHCETRVGACVAAYIESIDPILPILSVHEAREAAILYVKESGLIPDEGKNFAIRVIKSEHFLQTLEYPLTKLIQLLNTNYLEVLAQSNRTLNGFILKDFDSFNAN